MKYLDESGLTTFWKKIKGAFELKSNKVIDLGENSTDDQYPSAKITYASLKGLADSCNSIATELGNKADSSTVTELENSIDDHVPLTAIKANNEDVTVTNKAVNITKGSSLGTISVGGKDVKLNGYGTVASYAINDGTELKDSASHIPSSYMVKHYVDNAVSNCQPKGTYISSSELDTKLSSYISSSDLDEYHKYDQRYTIFCDNSADSGCYNSTDNSIDWSAAISNNANRLGDDRERTRLCFYNTETGTITLRFPEDTTVMPYFYANTQHCLIHTTAAIELSLISNGEGIPIRTSSGATTLSLTEGQTLVLEARLIGGSVVVADAQGRSGDSMFITTGIQADSLAYFQTAYYYVTYQIYPAV